MNSDIGVRCREKSSVVFLDGVSEVGDLSTLLLFGRSLDFDSFGVIAVFALVNIFLGARRARLAVVPALDGLG